MHETFAMLRDRDLSDISDWLALGVEAFGGYVTHTGTPWSDRDMVMGSLLEMLAHKQFDYGHENINAFGVHGLLVRINDKLARLDNLINRAVDAQNEALADTWLDICGYSIIALMLIDGSFQWPLAVDAYDSVVELPADEERPSALFDQDEAKADAEASVINALYDFVFGEHSPDAELVITIFPIEGEAA